MIRIPPMFRAAGAALFALALAACGGGTQVDPFQPTRLIVFGDETSVLLDANADGNARKFTVNGLKADNTTLDCTLNPIWVQTVATSFGLTFAGCNPNQVAAPNALMFAVPDARSADVATQIAAAGTFTATDLVTILAGANDVLDAYADIKAGTTTAADAQADLAARGKALADQVNLVANLGAKVLIVLVPNMGQTPLAVTEDGLVAGQAALLKALTESFNQGLRLNVINNGRKIGQYNANELVDAIKRAVDNGGSSFTNATQAACDVALAPQVQVCTTQTLVTGASGSTYLWADDRHLSPAGHLSLGSNAVSRITGNPF